MTHQQDDSIYPHGPLWQKLQEDSDQARDLWPAASRLPEWVAPRPTTQDTATLLGRLEPALLAPPLSWQARLRWGLALLQVQKQVLGQELWLGSALIIGLGVLLSLSGPSPALPLALLAPLAAALGVAFLGAPGGMPVMEIELATSLSQRAILLARLLLLFFLNLLVAVAGSLVLSLLHSQLSLWPLVLSWLAPMTFLTTLSFFCTVVLLDAALGLLLSLLLWALLVTRHYHSAWPRTLLHLPDLLADNAQSWLWLLALLLLVGTMFVAGRQEHFLQRELA